MFPLSLFSVPRCERVCPHDLRRRAPTTSGFVAWLNLGGPEIASQENMSEQNAAPKTFALTIRGGTLVTAENGAQRVDLGINDGKIAAIQPALPPGAVDIDASGLHLLPGGVDSHCHIEQKTSTGLTPVDNFFTAGGAALAGGTTCLIPFACQHRGERIRDVVAAYRLVAAKSAADYALHVIVTDPAEEHAAADLEQCFSEGISSVKVYMTYDALKLRDDQMLDVLALCRQHGAMVMVHAESHELIGWITRRLLAADQVAAKFHAVARPAIAEREAAHRAITFAEFIGTPLLIVHVSSAQAAEEIARARARGLPIFGETCPQYLELTQQCLCAPEEEGKRYLCSPPLRTEKDQTALWHALRRGDLQVVSSDHSAYNFGGGGAASKSFGGPSTPFAKVPMGLPGLETRLPLLVSGALGGKLDSLQQAVALACANPARLYGLYPRKGTLAVGSDADVVLVDVTRGQTISKGALHDSLDYTPYERMELRGLVVRTFLRGKTAFMRAAGCQPCGPPIAGAPADELSAERGGGEFISGGRPDLLGWSAAGERQWPDDADIVAQRCVEILGPNLDGVVANEAEGGRKRARADE